MPYTTVTSLNHDIAGGAERIDRTIAEIISSVSAGLDEITAADRTRIDSMNALLRSYFEWCFDNAVDAPQTHPRQYTLQYLADDYVEPPVANMSLRDACRMYQNLMKEMVDSASSHGPNSIGPHDYGRFTAHMDKIEAYFDNYVDQHQPLDMPETSRMLTARYFEAGSKAKKK